MRRSLPAAAALLALCCGPVAVAAAAPEPELVRFTVRVPEGARLGGQAELQIGMRIDVGRLRSPVTDVEILTPQGLDVASSGLGLATCRRPPAEVERVLVPGDEPAACPRNALLGSGTAGAALIFSPDSRPVGGAAAVQLFSGEARGGRPGLAMLVSTVNPMTAQLSYTGELFTAPRPFGLALRLAVRQIPKPLFGAQLALSRMQVTIGGSGIVYRRQHRGRAHYYRPGGVMLPERCSRGGLRFRLSLRFADESRRTLDARVPCPRRAARA